MTNSPKTMPVGRLNHNLGHTVLQHFFQCHNSPVWICGSLSPQCSVNQFWSCSKSLLSTLGGGREGVPTNVSEVAVPLNTGLCGPWVLGKAYLSRGYLSFRPQLPSAFCSFSGFIADPFGVWHATQYEMAGNTFLPGDDSCEALIADSSPESSHSLSACDLCGVFRFLVSNFDVLIEEKKKQTPLTFDNFRSHSSRFSQIQFHAFSISWSFTRHTHLNPTTEHCFSTFAMILHSALSRISLLLSWEHGLLILKLSNALKYSAHVSLYLMRPQDDRRPITVRKQAEGNRNSPWIGLSLFL